MFIMNWYISKSYTTTIIERQCTERVELYCQLLLVGINIMLQEMLGGLNRFKTHLISFIGDLLETVQKQ